MTPGLTEIVVLIVLVVLEAGLLWFAAPLGNAPDLSFVKLLGVAYLSAALSLFCVGLLAWVIGLFSSAALESWQPAILTGAGALFVCWVVPAALYIPMLPVSVGRGAVISLAQSFLRVFLYVLLGALVFVGLSLWQIIRQGETPFLAIAGSAFLVVVLLAVAGILLVNVMVGSSGPRRRT
jgi:hypothetical protein